MKNIIRVRHIHIFSTIHKQKLVSCGRLYVCVRAFVFVCACAVIHVYVLCIWKNENINFKAVEMYVNAKERKHKPRTMLPGIGIAYIYMNRIWKMFEIHE